AREFSVFDSVLNGLKFLRENADGKKQKKQEKKKKAARNGVNNWVHLFYFGGVCLFEQRLF
ncbi:MAG: hypothetical protein JWN60_1941, partial [Acidobacteria bacterium]|nr:hypothetical protein [Acidobacteriota bacterium]